MGTGREKGGEREGAIDSDRIGRWVNRIGERERERERERE